MKTQLLLVFALIVLSSLSVFSQVRAKGMTADVKIMLSITPITAPDDNTATKVKTGLVEGLTKNGNAVMNSDEYLYKVQVTVKEITPDKVTGYAVSVVFMMPTSCVGQADQKGNASIYPCNSYAMDYMFVCTPAQLQELGRFIGQSFDTDIMRVVVGGIKTLRKN